MSAKYFHNNLHSASPEQSTALILRLAFCWVAVGLRLGGKLAKRPFRFGWDDVLIIAALLVGNVGPILVIWSRSLDSRPLQPQLTEVQVLQRAMGESFIF